MFSGQNSRPARMPMMAEQQPGRIEYHPQDGTTDPPALDSRLGNAHNELASTITHLQSALEGLVQKLSPVIRPLGASVDAPKAAMPPAPPVSPAVDFVRAQECRLNAIIMDVNELYQRLDT